jgi:hypothetical protein
LRTYAVKTELVTSTGDHLRYVPGALAREMVNAGAAEVANCSGRVRAVRLVATASSHATRIGEPTPGISFGVRFTRLERLDNSAARVYQHHARCLYE